MKRAHNLPEAASVGLSLFAAAWVEKWTARGGSIFRAHDGATSIGMLEYRFSPMYEPPSGDVDAEWQQRQYAYRQAAHDGAKREMLELLELVPGGLDAVMDHAEAWAL